MPDHLVLCVHGIGNQKPGDTADDVLSGALAEHDRQPNATPVIADETIVSLFENKYGAYQKQSELQQRKTGEKDQNGNDLSVATPIHTPEPEEKPKREGKQKRFPMHVKRVRRHYSTRVETVIAEVYWADISPEPKGAFATIFDLIKVVASIGYLALDNAGNNLSPRAYSAVRNFLFALIGGVVVLNAALLMGVLVLLTEGALFNVNTGNTLSPSPIWADWLIAGTALIAIIFGRSALSKEGKPLPNKDEYPTEHATASQARRKAWGRYNFFVVLCMGTALLSLFIVGPVEFVYVATALLTLALARLIGLTRWEFSLWRVFSMSAGTLALFMLLATPIMTSKSAPDLLCWGWNPFCERVLDDVTPDTGGAAKASTENGVAAADGAEPAPANSDPLSADERMIFFIISALVTLLTLAWALSLALCLLVYAIWGWLRFGEVNAKYDRAFRLLKHIRATAAGEDGRARWLGPNSRAGLFEVARKKSKAFSDKAPRQQRRMYATVCSGLLLLWMLMASSFWMAVQSVTDGMRTAIVTQPDCPQVALAGEHAHPLVGGHCHEKTGVLPQALETFLYQMLPTMSLTVVFLILLVCLGLGIVVRRAANKHILFSLTRTKPSVGRLLLNPAIQWVFALSTLCFAVMTVFQVAAQFPQVGFGKELVGWTVGWVTRNDDKIQIFYALVPSILLGLGLIVYQLRDFVAGGLGAVRDVVVYANNNLFSYQGTGDAHDANFPPRQQIETRFRRVYDFTLDQVDPIKLTIISHSLGTIVATRALRKIIEERKFGNLREIDLVTMGSPVTHIHRKYFPTDFSIDEKKFKNVRFADRTYGEADAHKPIMRWFNIGRTDDFVGTYVENLDELNTGKPLAYGAEQAPTDYNLLVPAGGHPGYFTDPYVWQHFTTEMQFKLLSAT